MPTILSFDEVSKFNNSEEMRKAMPYDEYFGPMHLRDEQKEERISLAERLEDDFIYILMLLLSMRQYSLLDWSDMQKQLEAAIMATTAGYGADDDFSLKYAERTAKDIISTTKRHADDPYYYSMDRAMFLGENEANTYLNYVDYMQAIFSGKTKKRWVDMRDKRERKTHLRVGGTVKEITEPFMVGNSLLQFPKDTSLGAEAREIVNCRCSAEYF